MRINHLQITISMKLAISYGLVRNDAGVWITTNEAILHSPTGCKLKAITTCIANVMVEVRSYACDASDAIKCLQMLSKEEG